MGYRGTKNFFPNNFGETVTHQYFGTSSSITPHAYQNSVLSVPEKRKNKETLSFTLYNGKNDKKF